MTDEQVARLAPFLAESRATPRADDKRVLSGTIFINRNGSRWRDTPKKTERTTRFTAGESVGARKVSSPECWPALLPGRARRRRL
ncbi:transposase [Ruegeria sp. HKCCD6228]|uniref:Transposase n=1 Tax=Ruegeria atlantica TaxID=81569 RepID=A0AA90Z327_9RHOB|nr:transposase [Ruegeria sp. HKCCD6228]NOE19729.1 transposase [Ruegeria atlantica]